MLTVKSEVYECSIWVYQVDDSISILLVTGGEDSDLVFCGTLNQAFTNVWTYVNACFDRLGLSIFIIPNDLYCVLRLLAVLTSELRGVTVLRVKAVCECLV